MLSSNSKNLTFSEQSPKTEEAEESKIPEIKGKMDMNPYQHDNKTFVVFPDTIYCINALWSSADILAKKSQHHKVCVFYHGSTETNAKLFRILRERFFRISQTNSARYGFDVEQPKEDKDKNVIIETERIYLLKYLHETKPKFVVVGLQGGLSSSLIGNEKDVSFRQCIGATPIICKEKNTFNKKGHPPINYDNVIYAFQIDFSNDAMHAFKLMVDHFEDGDTIHLIWVKPDEEASNFQNRGAESLDFVFQPFKRILQDLKLNIKHESHISNGPNVGESLVSFVNDKRNSVDFLIAYCDLMGDYAKGKELIGSVSDYCVRHCQCSVIVPKLPTN